MKVLYKLGSWGKGDVGGGGLETFWTTAKKGGALQNITSTKIHC
jgi:hypothetical protein